MFCWSTIIDRDKNIYSAQSHRLVVPKFHQEVLKGGKDLGDYVREYLEIAPGPAAKHFGEIITFRRPFLLISIKSTLLNYLVE
jgi:hypothetical protein